MDFSTLDSEEIINRFELLETFIDHGVSDYAAYSAEAYEEEMPGLDEEMVQRIAEFREAHRKLVEHLNEYAKAADDPAYLNEAEIARLSPGSVEEQLSISC